VAINLCSKEEYKLAKEIIDLSLSETTGGLSGPLGELLILALNALKETLFSMKQFSGAANLYNLLKENDL